jgi:maltose alpha-D-glucosyltransferase/alpha-amylase
MQKQDLLWYKDAIIYELHVKAFCDGDGDGIGDFKGLLEKISYLKDLGVTAVWLLPFFPSPLKDDGYDIADYYNINPSYGNIKDFKKILRECHDNNLKVIIELVINHTSDQHEWFKRARNSPKDSPFRNYYVWSDDPQKYRDARIIFQDFEVSNWTWDPVAGQYYWHRFFHHQPDLNYDNPYVQEEVFKIIQYWCKMGVDGFRLDAVPYLFEREGTNCENLPETHTFLKSLRKYIDENFPNTMLLAEANMWPEDSASYFGNGDECHMNYNFPIMPRMFMALQMEDRFPITEIFEQTPAIPESCQWAIFLRNHDELTLEMVTDEERDYMYKVYVKDPLARINLGIRHRLAPLMANNRKKIELLNNLLFSFPGTPVIYYGDEIGMGDNFYLGDRDGVRTPMQWNSDRNSGFSRSNPQKLFLPVIIDPQYHYELVNVEMQSQNRSSLLWWTKRIISTRKKHLALSRGDIKFISSDNNKILAFVRSFKNEIILVVANLSRFSQPVELNLEDYKGYIPIEIHSKNKFPAIKDSNYFFNIGPYDCNWFILEKIQKDIIKNESLPQVELSTWKDFFSEAIFEKLETDIFPEYIKTKRWFGGKARSIHSFNIIDFAKFQEEQNATIFLIQVNYNSGAPEIYQIHVSLTTNNETAENLRNNFPSSIICSIKIGEEQGILYDALFGNDYQLLLFNKMCNNQKLLFSESEIQFSGNKALKKYSADCKDIKSKILLAEQSNTSITYDNKFFLKIYRKVDKVVNPDIEITKILSEQKHFEHIPFYLGFIEWNYGNSSMALGMIQEMIPESIDGWTYALDRLSNFNEKILSNINREIHTTELQGTLIDPVKYELIPEEIKKILDATVAERMRLLGIRTAELHIELSRIANLKDFKPENFSLHYQRSLFFSIQSLLRRTFLNHTKNIKNLPDDLRQEAEEILGMRDKIIDTLRLVYHHKFDALKTRIHGDYHLGQILFTGKDIKILDFEGEPSSSYSERRLKRSPLRDVAGMIRSFHYAAYSSLYLNTQIRKEDVSKLLPFVDQWYHYMSGFFMESYLDTVKNYNLIPSNPNDLEVLLQTFLIEKSIYELNYELNNRPDWIVIPIQGIKSVINNKIINANY